MTNVTTSVQAACHAAALNVEGLAGLSSPDLRLTNGSVTVTIPRSALGKMGLEAAPGDIIYVTLGLTRISTAAAWKTDFTDLLKKDS